MYYVVRYNHNDPDDQYPATVIGPFISYEQIRDEYYCHYYGWDTIVVGPDLQDYTPEEWYSEFLEEEALYE